MQGLPEPWNYDTHCSGGRTCAAPRTPWSLVWQMDAVDGQTRSAISETCAVDFRPTSHHRLAQLLGSRDEARVRITMDSWPRHLRSVLTTAACRLLNRPSRVHVFLLHAQPPPVPGVRQGMRTSRCACLSLRRREAPSQTLRPAACHSSFAGQTTECSWGSSGSRAARTVSLAACSTTATAWGSEAVPERVPNKRSRLFPGAQRSS